MRSLTFRSYSALRVRRITYRLARHANAKRNPRARSI